ncbi:MAG: hypothetical protein IJ007_07665 [Oscillospiraceae bacterium]|nr:hypothetical protein [Oscillospiraceae bacterium]
MHRVDFSTVINIIIENCRENMYTTRNRERTYSQNDLVTDIFIDHYEESSETIYSNSAISRWIKGNRPVPAVIVNYYRENGSEIIGDSFQENCIEIVFDLNKLYEDLLSLVRNDYSISEKMKNELLPEEKLSDVRKICEFIGKVIFISIDRPFIPSDKPMLPTSAITVSESVFGADVPPPCRCFCGRDVELSELHTAVTEHKKVFIQGFAGIGKSELAKAYAKKYKSDYKNILYFNYNDSLENIITDVDFIGDKPTDDEHTRFTNHSRFLKSLRSDSLIIIDNFNVSGAGDSLLGTVMKFPCNIIFTTRRNVDTGHIFKLDVIGNTDVLYAFASKYYSHSDEDKEKIYALIKAVHHHTLSVEMIAKLLEKGLHTTDEILTHLQINSVNPESDDKIKVTKDGENSKATYYNHIRSLFSLYLLDENDQTIMRCMVFAENVRIRYLAKLLSLNDTNSINELCDLGFIENNQADLISLHPMIRDVTVLDLKPDFENCDIFFEGIKQKILVIGNELPDSKIIISIIGNTVKFIDKRNALSYLDFLESAFTFLDNYKEYDLMQTIISEMGHLIKNDVGTANNKALLYNNKAMLLRNTGEKIPHAISLMNKALSLCDSNKNPVLFANLNMNLGLLYADNNDVKRGLEFMNKAYLFIKLCEAYNDDFITIARNYAATLVKNSMNSKAIEVLTECEFASEGCVSVNHARLIYDIGAMCVRANRIPAAVKKFNNAFSELSELGCYDEISARKIAAAEMLRKYGYEYPKEWETDYLE